MEPYVTGAVSFDLDVDLDTDATMDDQLRLIEAAKKGCFIEQTLAKGLVVGHRLKNGDDWVAA